jgi:hypothetical protein
VTENSKGYLLLNNDPIIWSMVNAIKEQQREIEQQQKLLRVPECGKGRAAETPSRPKLSVMRLPDRGPRDPKDAEPGKGAGSRR